MQIIEHRFGWCEKLENYKEKSLQNTIKGFTNSFLRKNGVETDIRDIKGKLVISHNMPQGDEISFEEMLEVYNKYNCKGTLALNIKCDGMQKDIKILLEKFNIKNYFMFDMSIPDTLGYSKNNIDFYIRESEYELNPNIASPILYEKAKGVWIDQFEVGNSSRISYDMMKKYLDDKKEICIVSPELHPWGRDEKRLYLKSWQQYKESFQKLISENYNLDKLSICVDFPEEAMKFFNEFIIN